MSNPFPFELISNFAAIVILALLFYRYSQYKKKLSVIEQLGMLKKEDKLSEIDEKFIIENELEYSQKLLKAESNIKLAKPVFIFLIGVIFIFFPLQEALINLNVIVVAFIYMQIDKIYKNNLYKLLFNLKK